MADNVTFPMVGSVICDGPSIFGTVERAGVHVQRVVSEWRASTGAVTTQAVISSTSSGPTTLVAGSTGQSVRTLGLFLKVSGAVDLSFYDGATTSGTQLVPPMPFTSGSKPFSLPLGPEPWMTASSTFGLMLHKSAGVSIVGRVYYTRS